MTEDRAADGRWMEEALAEAREAGARGEVPVGAVLVAADGTAIRDHNRTRERSDPTAHAEMEVLRRAAAEAGDWRLVGSTLYVTLEPCGMCAGAIVLARVARLVFAAADPKAGMCGSLGNLVQDARLNHRVELASGVGEAEAAALLKDFFRARR
ncbi:MAG: tRNA adenosine(34) deaminase TadA [Gemmatimonadota bacterium]